MGRKTQYQRITSPEKLAAVNPKNMALKKDFLSYLKSIQRSDGTIKGYSNDLDIVLVFILERCDNKDFVNVKKREWIALQSWLIDEHGNSPARVRRIKAVISSLSNYITDVLQEDDEPGFENFKPSIRGVENPVNTPVREKTILTDEDCQYVLSRLVEMKKYEQACYFALAIYSGRRKNELFRFKVEYFQDDHLICDGALYSTIELVKTKGRGVKGKEIPCYTLAKPFKPYFDLWMEERGRLGIESIWLFPKRDDMTDHRTGGSADAWASLYSELLSEHTGKASVFYTHSARHFAVSHMSQAGVPHSVIKEFMHWDSLEMVAIYDDTDIAESFGDYFTVDGIKGSDRKSLADL